MKIRIYTEAEEQFLREHYATKTAAWISWKLNRSVGSVQQKAFDLGISAINRNGVKADWTEEKVKFLVDNYDKMIIEKLVDHLGFSCTVVRDKMRVLGLRKCQNTKWKKEWDEFLKQNFEKFGDVDLAEMFEEKFPKGYPWTHKHIEKRRGYLGLKRQPPQIQEIRVQNVTNGKFKLNPVKRWAKTGVFPEGTIRFWRHNQQQREVGYIKVNGKYKLLNRYVWEQHHGEIPEGMCIRHIDGDVMNYDIKNLEMVTREENILTNGGVREISDHYVATRLAMKNKELRVSLMQMPELLELQRNIYKAKRLCKKLKEK